jgi:CRP-like cAMP-binding protein
MAGKTPQHSAGKNRIIAASFASDSHAFLQKLQPMGLSDKQVLYEQGDVIRYVYFPTTAVICLVSVMEDGGCIEIATTGHEGFVGAGIVLGIPKAFAKVIVQVRGEAFRMGADAFRSEFEKNSRLNGLVLRYTHSLLAQISRSGGCNSLHPVEQRCARWLLTMHDRSKTNVLPLTQEFLGEMLGVRRPSVSVVAAKLQKAGLIRYFRGKVKICNRSGLEKAHANAIEFRKKNMTA